jgi:hypothetical protein
LGVQQLDDVVRDLVTCVLDGLQIGLGDGGARMLPKADLGLARSLEGVFPRAGEEVVELRRSRDER